jgi:hypothetical protein
MPARWTGSWEAYHAIEENIGKYTILGELGKEDGVVYWR